MTGIRTPTPYIYNVIVLLIDLSSQDFLGTILLSNLMIKFTDFKDGEGNLNIGLWNNVSHDY
jgi:hypothetical protein